MPGCHLIQDRTEGKQIGSCVQVLALDLFRRHVSHCADCRARAGKMLLDVEGRGGLLRSCHRLGRELGQAKVQDFGVAAVRDKEVRRFNVAMNDSFGVSGIKRVGDLDS